jgi:OmpA family
MASGVKGQRGYIIEVQGFSSGKGQTAITNSQKMAESVVRYLVLNHEIPVYRIYLVGMGNAPAPTTDETAKTKRVSGGRVEVSLLKNDLEQLASNSSSSAVPASSAPASSAPASTSPSQGAPASNTPTTPQSQPAQPQPPQSPQQ